ncbi:MAG: phosphoribosylanthranilate isomerase [Clostridia bacterium]|nr:phosphoribosylanthranilate isomerase [Clostridia bacterium]
MASFAKACGRTAVKLCGLTSEADIEAANSLMPEYIGFVFWEKSKRRVTPERAAELKRLLKKEIRAVGVFVDEAPEKVAELLNRGIIDIAQLHGSEDNAYISALRKLTGAPIIKAFRITGSGDIAAAEASAADFVMLDAGKGEGASFDWSLVAGMKRPYFLAGGLSPDNVGQAARLLRPYAADVSSGIETDGKKDKEKMAAFVAAVRKEKAQ